MRLSYRGSTCSFVIGLPLPTLSTRARTSVSVRPRVRASVCPLNCIFCIAVQVTQRRDEEGRTDGSDYDRSGGGGTAASPPSESGPIR